MSRPGRLKRGEHWRHQTSSSECSARAHLAPEWVDQVTSTDDASQGSSCAKRQQPNRTARRVELDSAALALAQSRMALEKLQRGTGASESLAPNKYAKNGMDKGRIKRLLRTGAHANRTCHLLPKMAKDAYQLRGLSHKTFQVHASASSLVTASFAWPSCKTFVSWFARWTSTRRNTWRTA